MTPLTVIAIYCRSATGGLEGRANLGYQETDCRTYCEAHGLAIGMVHREIASGSTYREREQLGLMRHRYHSGHIQGVVVTDLYRLSRSLSHIVILLQEMEDCNVVLHCVREDLDDTTTGEFISMVVDIITEIEQEKALDTLLAEPER